MNPHVFFALPVGSSPASGVPALGTGVLAGVTLKKGFSTSSFVSSQRADGIIHEIPDSVISGDAIWPTPLNSLGQWWVYTTVSIMDPTFWDSFRKWQTTLEPGRLYAILITPHSFSGKSVTALESINLTRDWPLDKIIPIIEERVAKLAQKYNEEFLAQTDIRFKDIGAFKSSTPGLDAQGKKTRSDRT
jgi:hypothetical protein